MIKLIKNHELLTDFYKQFDFEIEKNWIEAVHPVFSVAYIENGRILGGCTLSYRNDNYILDYIGVSEKLRNKGIGRALFNKAAEYIKGIGQKKFYIVAKQPAFFEKTGAVYCCGDLFLEECIDCDLYNKSCFPKLMKYEVKMKIEDEIIIKSELLIDGVYVEEKAKRELLELYPDFFDKGFIHAVNISFGNTNVNVSVAENFSNKSPYALYEKDGKFFIKNDKYDFEIGFFGMLAKTDTVVDALARLHCADCINIWPSTNCCYDREGLKCKFCSLKKETEKPIDIDILSNGIKKLLENSKSGMLNFSGATYRNPDVMADYWIALVKKIRSFSNCKIAIEFAPPSKTEKLKELKDAGLDVAIMNLEVVDPELRKQICPGKSAITYEHYHEAFKKAVELFGWGQVSSVLIGGLQPKEDILIECEKMASMGVFPTIMPYRPLDNCEEKKEFLCTPEDLREMAMRLGEMLVKYKLDYKKQEGCTKCGGCSIENDCYRLAMEKMNKRA